MEKNAEMADARVSASISASASALSADNTSFALPKRVQQLTRPSAPNFTLAPYNEQARLLLAGQRSNKAGVQTAERQLRRSFSILNLGNSVRRSVTKTDVAVVFNGLLQQTPLPPSGLAQAVLSHASKTSTDELWRSLTTSHAAGPPGPSTTDKVPWLNTVTSCENLDYIHLLCHAGVDQSVLDDALGLALSRNSSPVIELLLRYGAGVSACKDLIRDRFRSDNVWLARLLLAVPSAVSVEEWQYCLRSRAASAPSVLTLCLVHHPDLASAQIFLDAVALANLPAMTIMLRGSYAADEIRNVSVEACRRAHILQSIDKKIKVMAMLAQAGMIRDTAFLQSELGRAVRLRQPALIRVLIDAGVSLDVNADNAFGSAIASLAFDMLESFASGDSAPLLAPALDSVPDSASEEDILRLLFIFRDHMGEPGAPLHRQLVRAVRSQRITLIQALLDCGAAVDFQDCEAVKETIRKADRHTLKLLLGSQCSERLLSEAVPTALSLETISSRYDIMECLLSRGSAPSQTLAGALLALVSTDGPADLKLIRLILDRGAPLDWIGDGEDTCIMVCTRKGDLPLLQLLCASRPQAKTLSQAIPVAFRMTMEAKNYKVALGVMIELLHAGAEGPHVHETLLEAARHDKQLNGVRALLKHGGDANHENGACYAIALEKENPELLRTICQYCPPSQATLQKVLPRVVDSRKYRGEALVLLLSSSSSQTAATALNGCWSLGKFKENSQFAAIAACFLKYGLDVNADNGSLLSHAIQTRDKALLQSAFSVGPNIATLTIALSTAAKLSAVADRAEMMELVLRRAGSSDIGQSRLLPPQTLAAVAGDLSAMKVLLRHRAAADFNNGEPVYIAAKAGCLEVLDLLLQSKIAWSFVTAACQIVLVSSLESKKKKAVFQCLLDGASETSAKNMSELLAISIVKHPKSTELPTLLLASGAEPDLETCQFALSKVPVDRFVTLVQNVRNRDVGLDLFKYVVKASLPTQARYRVYESLLSKDIPKKDVSVALLQCLKADRVEDLRLLELLLEHGADVAHENGLAFRRALLGAESVDAFMLLTRHVKDDSTAGIAFDIAHKANVTHNRRLIIYRTLLRWNIRRPNIQEALVSLLKGGRCDSAVLQMLLRNGADPNRDDAQCFILACNAEAETEFRALSSKAEVEIVTQALMARFRADGQVVRWLQICLEGHPRLTKLNDGGLLFECLRKYPEGSALLKLLLSKVVAASATTLHSVAEGWPPEQCTALVKALSSKPKVSNEAILTLLDRAGADALPAFFTPSKEVSAAFLCLLDKSRTDIIKALLRLDRDRVLSHEMPARSFEHLALSPALPDPNSSNLSGKIPLQLAALLMGNLDAFRLLSKNRTPNDGTLHSAALFALPDFVEWCLRTDDPNVKDEHFESRIPLALACEAKYLPYCRIGNKTDFRTRQKETMRRLAPRTDPKYHEKHRTVLHIALHKGPETTAAMLDALNVAADSDRHAKYRYTDQEGRKYSPREYVTEIMGCDQDQKQALLACLSKAGLDAMPDSWH